MANTYVRIASSTLTSSQATVSFTGIPSSYTDLVLKMSVKTTAVVDWDTFGIYLNNDTTALYSSTFLRSDGTTVTSTGTTNDTSMSITLDNGANNANFFTIAELYLPSYTNSQNKPSYSWGNGESNITLAYMRVIGNLYRSTSAISSIYIGLGSGPFAANSSFFLYGIKNS